MIDLVIIINQGIERWFKASRFLGSFKLTPPAPFNHATQGGNPSREAVAPDQLLEEFVIL